MSEYKLVVPIGENESGAVVNLDLLELYNLLIIFPKLINPDSEVIRLVLNHLFANVAPEIVRAIVVDLCSVGLKAYDGDKHLLTPVIGDIQRVISAHQWVNKEINKRLDLFARSGVKTIEEYNALEAFTTLEYILLVDVDLTTITEAAPAAYYDLIDMIMMNARRTGFILIATTRQPRNRLSRLFRNRIIYRTKYQEGTINYLSYGTEMVEKIKLGGVSEGA